MLPKKLNKSPLYEAVLEIKFKPTSFPVPDVLPGMLWDTYNDYEIIKLPISMLPQDVILKDPNLIYAVKVRMNKGNSSVQLGDRIITLNSRKPYPGWELFKKEIKKLIESASVIQDSLELETLSLTYLNLLPEEDANTIKSLDLDITCNGRHFTEEPIVFKTNYRDNDLVNTVDIMTHARIQKDNNVFESGITIIVNSAKDVTNKKIGDLPDYLDEIHNQCKEMFYGLLKPETLSKLGPVE